VSAVSTPTFIYNLIKKWKKKKTSGWGKFRKEGETKKGKIFLGGGGGGVQENTRKTKHNKMKNKSNASINPPPERLGPGVFITLLFTTGTLRSCSALV
jgi:hypothetical protein